MISKKTNSLIKKIILIFALVLAVFSVSSCRILNILLYPSQSEVFQTDIKIEDIESNKIKSIEASDIDIVENIENRAQIDMSEEAIRDPFMPPYLNNEVDISESNTIILEKIYTEDNIFYCEIIFNDFYYKLKKDDQFGKIYQIKAINEASIVFLKGDEIITIFIGEIYYDQNTGT